MQQWGFVEGCISLTVSGVYCSFHWESWGNRPSERQRGLLEAQPEKEVGSSPPF